MTSPERGFALWQAVKHVVDNNIPGAFVECGVWKGGSSLIMVLTLLELGAANRDIYLFDTFDGMTDASPYDRDLHGHSAGDLMEGSQGEVVAELVQARATLDTVKNVMATTGYDERLLHYVPGDVRETLARTQTLHIALLRLDTDFYDSTMAEMEVLYPRVRTGAPVIVDDFGHWQGAQKAIEDYFGDSANGRSAPMLWAIDYTGRGFTKIEECQRVEIDRYDYVPSGMPDPKLLKLFPFAEEENPWAVDWPHLRPSVPHKFRSDTRNERAFTIGNASYEEAVCLHAVAVQFSGRRGLEIGTHFGWTGAHLRAAGLELDLVDPEFSNPDRVKAVEDVLKAAPCPETFRTWAGYSPDCLAEVRTAADEPWSFCFIDGNHDGDAPENDAKGVLGYCAEDAVVMFHDMTSPDVARGLAVFQDAGWNVGLFNTMQVLGVAWRGEVKIPMHNQDPNMVRLFYPHLTRYDLISEWK